MEAFPIASIFAGWIAKDQGRGGMGDGDETGPIAITQGAGDEVNGIDIFRVGQAMAVIEEDETMDGVGSEVRGGDGFEGEGISPEFELDAMLFGLGIEGGGEEGGEAEGLGWVVAVGVGGGATWIGDEGLG